MERLIYGVLALTYVWFIDRALTPRDPDELVEVFFTACAVAIGFGLVATYAPPYLFEAAAVGFWLTVPWLAMSGLEIIARGVKRRW